MGTTIDEYFKRIEDIKPLSPEEETRHYICIYKYKEREDLNLEERREYDEAVNSIVCNNLRFVWFVASEFHRYNPSSNLMDLIQQGNIGMIEAARKFDYKRKVKFCSYAVYWVKRSMMTYILENKSNVRMPSNIHYLISKIRKIQSESPTEDLDIKAISEMLNLSERYVDLIMKCELPELSLNSPLRTSENEPLEGCSFLDTLLIQNEEYAFQRYDLNRLMNGLGHREKRILSLYFGLNGEEGMSLEKIGKKFRLTRESIRQIKKGAIKRMRRRVDNGFFREHL